jgi:protein-L-isoaspartate(D-aspartate) O-methyltransferase
LTSTTSTTDPRPPGELREAMTDRLIADGMITSPAVEAAFRAVPRHMFVPAGTSADRAYGADVSVITKSDANGAHLSSVSAPWLQATMIAQAGISAGMKVLEIGSGGYNAALLAEVTGEHGRVVTMDIDPEITARASGALEAAGYGDRVTVVTDDGENGSPDYAPYDAIIVTVGAWDLPPSWIGQLTSGGTLVVPLRMNSVTRSLAFRLKGDHLASTSAEMCGFVPMQGRGARSERTFRLPDPSGGYVTLRFDEGAPDDPSQLDGALGYGPVTAWSGARIGQAVSFADLHLWFAGFLPGFCRIAADDATGLAAQHAGTGWFPFGCAHGDSFAYQANRKLNSAGDPQFEFGAGAYGSHAQDAADLLVEQVQVWDQHGRNLPGDSFAFWPTGTPIRAQSERTAVFRKIHGAVTVDWPGPVSGQQPQPRSE